MYSRADGRGHREKWWAQPWRDRGCGSMAVGGKENLDSSTLVRFPQGHLPARTGSLNSGLFISPSLSVLCEKRTYYLRGENRYGGWESV